MKSLLVRVSVLFLLLTLHARAIIDFNENGVSDLWEKHFNFGELYSNFDPDADPDGDGWTNAQEASAGTDPDDANPPAGFIRPKITHIPAVYSTPEDPEEEPVILSPEAVTIVWPTFTGKQYSLFFSPDLSAGSWIRVGNSRTGDGTEMGKGIPLTQPDGSIPAAMFWRVAVEDIDTDSDTLTDFEELQIGSSIYLADTDGDGIDDATAYAAGKHPAGEDTDGDGVPDSALYSVEFEVREEFHEMPYGVGHPVLAGTDNIHRYLTLKQSEEYSVSGSARYGSVSDGEQVWTSTYLDGGAITADGQPVTGLEGTSLSDWEYANHISLGQDEYLMTSTTQTAVTGPSSTATEIVTTTTHTTPWVVKKHVQGNPNDIVVRSGTETIIVTDRTKLTDPVTYQDLWTTYLKPKPWAEWDVSDPSIYGPHNWKDYNRAYLGDADAAEFVRDYFRSADFDIFSNISSPGSSPIDYGSDNRLKSLRWRWVRFNPLTPFDLEYAAPPESYQQRFHFLVQQRNFLRDRSGSPPVITIDEEMTKGVVEIECNSSEGAGWHTVDLAKFSAYKLEEPTSQVALNFSNQGYSQVWFGNLPMQIIQGALNAPDLSIGDWLTTEASLTPEVEMEIASAEVVGTGLEVRVTGTVTDEISRLAEDDSDKLQSIRFSIFGDELRAVNLTGDVGIGATFDETFTIPNAKSSSYTIRAKTDPNKAGNTAWDEIAVSLQLVSRPNSSGVDSSLLRIAFPIIPSAPANDTVQVYFADRDALASDASLTETAGASYIFSGQLTYGSGTTPGTIMLRGPLNFDATSLDYIDLELAIGAVNSAGNTIRASLVETGANTRVFKVPAGTVINNDFHYRPTG